MLLAHHVVDRDVVAAQLVAVAVAVAGDEAGGCDDWSQVHRSSPWCAATGHVSFGRQVLAMVASAIVYVIAVHEHELDTVAA
jgi:hypothetical protein